MYYSLLVNRLTNEPYSKVSPLFVKFLAIFKWKL